MAASFINYLITDPHYYSSNVEEFKDKLSKTLQNNHVNYACFRDKNSENFTQLAKTFVDVCRDFNIEKILINENYELAKELNAHGVHLTSEQFDKIKEAKAQDLYVIVSCHNFSDIEKAQNSFANAVTFSPIFSTPNKPEPKGINSLKQAISLYEDMDIIALGGIITEEHINQIKKTNAFGFASIRYFI